MARKAQYTEQLPPTPCTPAMRKSLLQIAEREEISIAEVQRRAFNFFLSQNDSKARKS